MPERVTAHRINLSSKQFFPMRLLTFCTQRTSTHKRMHAIIDVAAFLIWPPTMFEIRSDQYNIEITHNKVVENTLLKKYCSGPVVKFSAKKLSFSAEILERVFVSLSVSFEDSKQRCPFKCAVYHPCVG